MTAPTPASGNTAHLHLAPTYSPQHASYTVGAYYFSGWSHGQQNNLTPLLLQKFPRAEPLAGWYDDTQSSVDQSISQASNAGINFFGFDWYDIPMSRSPTDRTLNEGLKLYLTSSKRTLVKFSLVYIDQAPFLPSSPARWATLVKEWVPYFKLAGYQYLNGKPLFTVFSPEHLLDVFHTPAAINHALRQLRQAALAAGLPGVTIAVAATVAAHSNPARVQQLVDEGFDVATGYNYHSLGHEHYRVAAPYASLISESAGVWSRIPGSLHLPYVPVVTSGWDQSYSAREQATAIIYGGRTPAHFACFAALARSWIDKHPAQATQQRMVMIFAWNEIGEGGAIIPNQADGYAYATKVGDVFGRPGHAPTVVTNCS